MNIFQNILIVIPGILKCVKNKKNTVFSKYGVENVSYLNEVKEKIIKKNTGGRRSEESKRKMSKSHKGKILTKQHKKNIGLSGRIDIDYIEKRYPLFSKIEEMKYNSDKPIEEKEIQFHCKYFDCENSKEKGGWFTPSKYSLSDRIRALESKRGNDANYFYCSDECKLKCSVYNKRIDYLLKDEAPNQDYQTFRKHVLTRDNNVCQFCGDEATDVHHERPQKLEPFFALDPDFAWSCCEECHYSKGHSGECNTRNLADKVCQQKIAA